MFGATARPKRRRNRTRYSRVNVLRSVRSYLRNLALEVIFGVSTAALAFSVAWFLYLRAELIVAVIRTLLVWIVP